MFWELVSLLKRKVKEEEEDSDIKNNENLNENNGNNINGSDVNSSGKDDSNKMINDSSSSSSNSSFITSTSSLFYSISNPNFSSFSSSEISRISTFLLHFSSAINAQAIYSHNSLKIYRYIGESLGEFLSSLYVYSKSPNKGKRELNIDKAKIMNNSSLVSSIIKKRKRLLLALVVLDHNNQKNWGPPVLPRNNVYLYPNNNEESEDEKMMEEMDSDNDDDYDKENVDDKEKDNVNVNEKDKDKDNTNDKDKDKDKNNIDVKDKDKEEDKNNVVGKDENKDEDKDKDKGKVKENDKDKDKDNNNTFNLSLNSSLILFRRAFGIPEHHSFSEMSKYSDKGLADTVKELLGACYITGGFSLALKFFTLFIVDITEMEMMDVLKNIKNTLIERDKKEKDKGREEKDMEDLDDLRKLLNLKETPFNNVLLSEVFKDSSNKKNGNSATQSYERLTFLGESLMDFEVAEYLYRKYDTTSDLLYQLKKTLLLDNFLSFAGAVVNLPRYIKSSSVILAEEIKEFPEKIRRTLRCSDNSLNDSELWNMNKRELPRELSKRIKFFPFSIFDYYSSKTFSDIVISTIGAVFVDSVLTSIQNSYERNGSSSSSSSSSNSDIDIMSECSSYCSEIKFIKKVNSSSSSNDNGNNNNNDNYTLSRSVSEGFANTVKSFIKPFLLPWFDLLGTPDKIFWVNPIDYLYWVVLYSGLCAKIIFHPLDFKDALHSDEESNAISEEKGTKEKWMDIVGVEQKNITKDKFRLNNYWNEEEKMFGLTFSEDKDASEDRVIKKSDEKSSSSSHSSSDNDSISSSDGNNNNTNKNNILNNFPTYTYFRPLKKGNNINVIDLFDDRFNLHIQGQSYNDKYNERSKVLNNYFESRKEEILKKLLSEAEEEMNNDD